MLSILSLSKYIIIQAFCISVAIVAIGVIIIFILKKGRIHKTIWLAIIAILGILIAFLVVRSVPHSIGYPFFLKTYGPADSPALPLKHVLTFLGHADRTSRVENISRDPNDLPPPTGRDHSETVKVTLIAKEVIAEMAPGVYFNYWTFDGKVPGPFIRAREGDTVELTLKNDPTSINAHNIDLHAVTGPGGGAVYTNVKPGESKTITFKTMNPGIFVYHCAHSNPATHMAHGMYGLILVEPKAGLPKVDKEFYVMQGEFYSTGNTGRKGIQIFDAGKMLDSKPEYVVFNGRVGGIMDNMKAKTGQQVRMYVGNGGVNLVSSFHVIGEIFDTVFLEGSIGGPLLENVQSTVVPAGGASIVQFGLQVPGKYILVDHALARMDKGAWGVLQVEGEKNEAILKGEADPNDRSH